MAFRFWRRIRLLPGVTLNLSKSTASLSFGPRGAKYTVSPRGNRATAGIPGTGLFYTVHDPGGDKRSPPPEPRADDPLDLGFFRRLFVAEPEEDFVDGLKAVRAGERDAALAHFDDDDAHADSVWMAAMLRLERQEFRAAAAGLEDALGRVGALGTLFSKYGIDPTVSLPVSDEITAHVGPRPRGTWLALAEVRQQLGETRGARAALEQALGDAPDDIVAIAALAELLLDADEVSKTAADRVVRLTAGVDNDTPVHAAALLYKARALRALGMDDAAVKTFTRAYRKRKDRPEELRRQIRYERALAYAAIGRRSRSRRELEGIYADDPDFEDVSERLGLADDDAG